MIVDMVVREMRWPGGVCRGIVVHSLVFLVGLASRAEAISMQGLILDERPGYV